MGWSSFHRASRARDIGGEVDYLPPRCIAAAVRPASAQSSLSRRIPGLTVTRYLDNGAPATTVNTYDTLTGNLLATIDPLGHATTFTYTAQGQIKTITDALAHITTFEYNPAGDLIKVTDPLNNVSQTLPDLAGRATQNRSGPANLNNALSGNSGHYAGL